MAGHQRVSFSLETGHHPAGGGDFAYFLLGGVGLQLSNAAPLILGSSTWVLQDTSYPCLYEGLMGKDALNLFPFRVLKFHLVYILYFLRKK